MKHDRVALLIDADNVSIDVIEQSVVWVAKHFGGPHLRRAYCTPEAAVKHQDAFKRLSVRPMVNLAAGKNSTDIALAVDAIEIAINEQPDIVVIASSDSDFAPVVARLRERGCRVVGIGQQGKVGQETQGIYDDFEVIEHRGGDDAAPPARKRSPRASGASGASRASAASGSRTTAKKTAAGKTAAKKAAPAKTPRKTAARKRAADDAVPAVSTAAVADDGDSGAVVEPPARKATSRGRGRGKSAVDVAAVTLEAPPPPPPAAPPSPRGSASPAAQARGPQARGPHPRGADSRASNPRASNPREALLQALPGLEQGASLASNDVGQRLRAAGLLGRSGSSIKLLKRVFGDELVLEPNADNPSRVRLASAG